MADTTEPTESAIFATDESLATAIANARAGDRHVARILLDRFCDRGVRGLAIEPDLRAYIGDCLWRGTRQFIRIREQWLKLRRDGSPGVQFRFDKDFNLQAANQGRPRTVGTARLKRELSTKTVDIPKQPRAINNGHVLSQHEIPSDKLKQAYGPAWWNLALRARLNRLAAACNGGPAAYPDALAVINFFCWAAAARVPIDEGVTRHIADALSTITVRSGGDTAVLLGLKHSRRGRRRGQQAYDDSGWAPEVREAAWRFALDELLAGTKPADIVTKMVGSQIDHDTERAADALFAATVTTWKTIKSPLRIRKFVATCQLRCLSWPMRIREPWPTRVLQTVPMSRKTARASIQHARAIINALDSIDDEDVAAAAKFSELHYNATPVDVAGDRTASVLARWRARRLRNLCRAFGLALAEVVELHARRRHRRNEAKGTLPGLSSEIQVAGRTLDRSRSYATVHYRASLRVHNKRRPAFEQGGAFFDCDGNAIDSQA